MQRISNNWNDYECIDAGNGEKLERWGNVILRRPDPQAIWNVEKKVGNMMLFIIALTKVEDIGNTIINYQSNGQYLTKI